MKILAWFVVILGLLVGGIYATYLVIFPTYYVRYRLTVDVDVAGVTHTGSGVVGISYQIMPDNFVSLGGGRAFTGIMRGYAVTVDLGERGLLFVVDAWPLLMGPGIEKDHPAAVRILFPNGADMGSLPLVAYGFPEDGLPSRMKELVQELERKEGKVDVSLGKLPMMVHFRDLKYNSALYEVDPMDLLPSFGPDVHISRAAVELTQEPVTSIPHVWPEWLAKAQNLSLYLMSDDERLRVAESHLGNKAFKGE